MTQQVNLNRLQIPRFIIRLKTKYIFVRPDDISHIAADGNTCKLHLSDGKKLDVQKSMTQTAALLAQYNFLRVHKSHIVNLAKIVKLEIGNISTVVLDNGEELSISRSKKEILLSYFRSL